MAQFIRHRVGLITMALLANVVVGCSAGSGLPPTSPGEGKIVLKGGDVRLLEGGTVQFQLATDPTIVAVGDIQADGTFRLKTWGKDGQSAPEGVVAGEHRVRIEPPTLRGDENQVASVILDKYRDFNKSGLRVAVPSDKIELAVEKRRK